MSFDSVLLNTIESEIMQNNTQSYQKVIPIRNYTYETKRTLDYIIDKYGGFINRYDDKVIVFIHEKKQKLTQVNQEENHYASLKFDKINSSIKDLNERISTIEEKVNQIYDEISLGKEKANRNMENYLSYFRNKTEKREISRLIDEIINHN